MKNKIVIAILVGAVIIGGALYFSRTSTPASVQSNILDSLNGSDSSVKSTQSPDSDCLIKGNISSSGKIYHMPGCGSYEKTVIDTSSGEKWFCSEQEAIAAGWRKAKNCP